jgi:hypothetical protein
MAKKTKARNQGRNQGTSAPAPESAEQPVSDEIRRAGERIGYERRQLAKDAARATDNLSEALAVIEQGHPEAAADCINRAALAIWQIRWELQAVPS